MATKTSEARIGTTRANGRECLINADTADDFLLGLARYQQTDKQEAAELEVASRQSLELAYGYDDSTPEAEQKPFVFKDGVAVIPVHGTLLNRFNSSWGFVTGYNFIRRQMNLALADEDVEMIVLDVDSPGGEAAGNFELCREIMAARDEKPILAVVDSVAASGGYSIIACCTRSYAIPSARIGSIGVYRMHIDISKMLENEGVKITFAKAGKHKTDGNSFEPLPDSVKQEWEESVGRTWDDFIALVAEGRGISPAQVRDTQARVYRADEALDLGLIDAVKTTSEAVASFIAELAEDEPYSDEDENMADQNTARKPAAAAPEVASAPAGSQPSQDAIAAAIAAHDARQRERRVAIKALDESKSRPALTASLIENTDLTVEQCKVVLADAAEETPPEPAPDEDEDEAGEEGDEGDEDGADSAKGGKGKAKVKARTPADNVNHLDRAMGGVEHPKVGAGKEQGRSGAEGEPTDSEQAAGILGSYAKMTGRKIELPAA